MLLEQIAHVPISRLPKREPVRVRPDAQLGDVILAMNRGRTGAALVVEGTDLVGIFTEHDLLRRVDLGTQEWREHPVSMYMTEKPRAVREDETIAEAMRRMDAGRHRHLPVVRGREAVAVVSIRDLLAFLTTKFPADFINLPPDPDKEARGPWGG